MLKSSSRLTGAIVLASGFLVTDARLAVAQEQTTEGLQEVVVTAERRTENLQTTPIAITALSAETLDKAGVVDFAGVAEQSTSINFTPYPSSSNTLILYMRGQGVADANQTTQDGSVGLYEDGFYIARPQAETFDLADVDRVEILRGPQGTLYGRNTTGGAVNIISKKPTGEFDVKFQVDGGQRDYARALGTMNLPTIGGGLMTKITLLYSNLAGNVSNYGYTDFNRENQKGGRLSLRWDTGGMFTADYFYEVGEIDSTPIYYQNYQLNGLIPGYNVPTDHLAGSTWTGLPLTPSVAKFNSDGLTLNFKINDENTIRSLTYYRGLDSRFNQNYAASFTDPLAYSVTGTETFLGNDIVQSNEFTQELQWVGSWGKVLDWVGGLYYYHENSNHAEAGSINDSAIYPLISPPYPPGSETNYLTEFTNRYVTATAKSEAVYAQITWHVTDPFSITVGGRETEDHREAARTSDQQGHIFINVVPAPFPPAGIAYDLGYPAPINESANLKFNKFNPAATLNYAFNPDVNGYLRYATGYKAGGVAESGPVLIPPATSGGFDTPFSPENVTTYELGLKSYWWEHRVRANVALFHSTFNNMQMQFEVDPTNPAIVTGYNAGKATINGAEFEMLFALTPDLTVGLNDTLLSTDMKDVYVLPGTIFDPAINHASPYAVGDNVASLFRVPYAPNNILGANIDWTLLHHEGGSLELYLDYRYQGRQYDTAPTGVNVPGSAQYYSVDAYGLMNGKLTWNFDTHNSKKSMKVSLWGKNILNKDYLEHIIGGGAAPFVPNANSPVQTGYYYSSQAWAPKAMFGAEFSYGF
jgi:iron complex outermembrane recepter protein